MLNDFKQINEWNVLTNYVKYLARNTRECTHKRCVSLLINIGEYLLQHNRSRGYTNERGHLYLWNDGDFRRLDSNLINHKSLEFNIQPCLIFRLMKYLAKIDFYSNINGRYNFRNAQNARGYRYIETSHTFIGPLRFRTNQLLTYPSIFNNPYIFEVLHDPESYSTICLPKEESKEETSGRHEASHHVAPSHYTSVKFPKISEGEGGSHFSSTNSGSASEIKYALSDMPPSLTDTPADHFRMILGRALITMEEPNQLSSFTTSGASRREQVPSFAETNLPLLGVLKVQFLEQLLLYLRNSAFTISQLCIILMYSSVMVYGPALRNYYRDENLDGVFNKIKNYIIGRVLRTKEPISFRLYGYLINALNVPRSSDTSHSTELMDKIADSLITASGDLTLGGDCIENLCFGFTRAYYKNDELYEKLAQIINTKAQSLNLTVTINLILSFKRINKLQLIQKNIYDRLKEFNG